MACSTFSSNRILHFLVIRKSILYIYLHDVPFIHKGRNTNSVNSEMLQPLNLC